MLKRLCFEGVARTTSEQGRMRTGALDLCKQGLKGTGKNSYSAGSQADEARSERLLRSPTYKGADQVRSLVQPFGRCSRGEGIWVLLVIHDQDAQI
jgi:hypothetical protein